MSNVKPVSEHALHKQVADFLGVALPAGVAWTSVDHASASSAVTGAQRKARGVKAGQGDIRLVLPPNGTSAEIELKTSVGRVSPAQLAWKREVEAAGALYGVARSIEDVQEILTEWGVELRGRAQ